MRCILLAIAMLALSACGSGSASFEEDQFSADENEIDASNYDETEKGGETYEEYNERRESYGGGFGSYEGDGCTVDCSGHEAGHAWAEENGIDDPDDCGGNSWSFEEGCRSYAEDNQF